MANAQANQLRFTFWEITVSEAEAEETGFDWLFSPSTDRKPEFTGIFRSLHRSDDRFTKQSEVIRGVFSDPQFQFMLKHLKKKRIETIPYPTVAARPGQPVVSERTDQRFGAVATLGSDGETINLSVFLPKNGNIPFNPGEPHFRIPLSDGFIVAFSTGKGDNARPAFVKAEILDPGGKPMRFQSRPQKP